MNSITKLYKKKKKTTLLPHLLINSAKPSAQNIIMSCFLCVCKSFVKKAGQSMRAVLSVTRSVRSLFIRCIIPANFVCYNPRTFAMEPTSAVFRFQMSL